MPDETCTYYCLLSNSQKNIYKLLYCGEHEDCHITYNKRKIGYEKMAKIVVIQQTLDMQP